MQELEYEEHEVDLFMSDDDKRFGFSVIGGYDEGIAPRVDDITAGRWKMGLVECKEAHTHS